MGTVFLGHMMKMAIQYPLQYHKINSTENILKRMMMTMS